MFLNGENPIIRIMGVEHMVWEGGRFEINPRIYSALAFRVKGNAEITVRGKKYTAGTTDILYLPQNLKYHAEYTDTEIIVFHFITLKDDTEPEIYSVENSQDIFKMFLQARSFWESKNAGFSLHVMSILYSILGKILEGRARVSLPPHFINAVSIIMSDFKNSNISVSHVCKSAGICETSFRKLFKKYYFKTPIEYITDLRIDNAKSLISSGASVESAALESGFNDPKYFARIVKKKLGCAPRELKNFGK